MGGARAEHTAHKDVPGFCGWMSARTARQDREMRARLVAIRGIVASGVGAAGSLSTRCDPMRGPLRLQDCSTRDPRQDPSRRSSLWLE